MGTMYKFSLAALLVGFLVFVGCGKPDAVPQAEEEAPLKVKTRTAETRDVQTQMEFIGRTVAIHKVDVVSRVPGFIETREFVDGALVEANQPLFEIQKFEFENAIAQDEKQLEQLTAKSELSRRVYESNVAANERAPGAISELDVVRSKSDLDADVAALGLCAEKLAYDKRQLEYATIRAPIRGKVTAAKYTQGAYLSGSPSEILCSVYEIDAMYVQFQITDALLSRLMSDKSALRGTPDGVDSTVQSDADARDDEHFVVPFEATLANSETDDVFNGFLDYIDASVDVSTGSILVRGKIDNSDHRLFPGCVCRVKLNDKSYRGALVIDERAVCNDMTSKYVWIVEDGKAARRYIETERVVSNGNERIVKPYEEREAVEINGEKSVVKIGLKPGEKYIVDGTIRLLEGSKVEAFDE